MRLIMLQAKLHRAHVTHSEVEYEGSCAIDSELLEVAGIREYQQISIYNVTNGERFQTYAILGEKGSKIISVNGAAAHRAAPGECLIICAYAEFEEAELVGFKPKLVYLDENNDIKQVGSFIPTQVA
ncbi:MAG: aspartate 1-decarboxylase [Gammaproteobacteria bacterium]|nr:aspartate 1-decarboxylase [Gammaproteobacteria bacterium]